MYLSLRYTLGRRVKGDQVEKGLEEGVVRRLTHNILNRNHQVYFDNFFTIVCSG